MQKKCAVITGTNRGMGRVIAEVLAKEGYDLIACARRKSENYDFLLSSLREKYTRDIMPVYFDLGDEKDVERGGKEILSFKRAIDVLVHNAGDPGSQYLFSMTKMADIKKTFQINFFSPMLLTKVLLSNMMRNRHGSIVHIASIAAIDGDPAQFEYVSSKAALIGATKQMSRELASFGIRVNAVAPGMIDTDMAHGMKEETIERFKNKAALRRFGRTEEVANVVKFLASDESSYMTGQILRVDGGI